MEGGSTRHLSSRQCTDLLLPMHSLANALVGCSFLSAIKFPLANFISIAGETFTGAAARKFAIDGSFLFISTVNECVKFTNSNFIEGGNAVYNFCLNFFTNRRSFKFYFIDLEML